ncbi:MAG: hypothetical protein WHT07_04915 [Desulfobaccales bacterium]
MSPGRKKTPASLPPLSPEAAARLAALKEEVRRGLEAELPVEELLARMGAPEPDPAWPEHLLATLAELRHPGVPRLLAALFGREPDPRLRKALKKALHRLQTQGIPVPPDLLPAPEAASRPPVAPEVTARVTPIFGQGERFLVLEGSRAVLGGTVVVARLSDTAGLLEFHNLAANRAQRQELKDSLAEQGLSEWAEVPPAYAVRLLEEAYALHPEAAAAAEYAAIRERLWRYLGRPEEAPDPESAVPAVSDLERAPALEYARELARHPWFYSWLPEPARLTPWLAKLAEAEASPLILAEHQKQARREGILEEAVRELFPPEGRELLRRRLLHQAYYCHLRHFLREAQALKAAAQDLAARQQSPLLGESPFLLALVESGLRLARESQRPQAPGLVAPPVGSPLILRK